MDRRQLDTSNSIYRLLVESITDYAIYMLSPAGVVSSWSRGAERIKGYTREEVLGTHFSRFYTDEDRISGEPARVLAIAAREGRFEAEARRIRKDGTVFWAHIVIDALYDENRNVTGFAKVTRDITEQRAARDAILQMQKMEAIGQLTGGVAHDFNNLLAAIMSSLELLKKHISRSDERSAGLLENAVAAVNRGAALTQRLLAFARRQDLRMQAVDIGALVQGMSGLLTRSIGGGLQIDVALPLALPAVHCDAHQLELALLNLVLNARDAAPPGGTITIKVSDSAVVPSQALRPGRYICIAVIDHGHGMDEKTLARAVEPFFTTKGVGKGSGLGLPMVDGLAQQCGGRLLLDSAVGHGTTAEVWLPVAAPEACAKDPESPIQLRPSGLLSVLVVDDDALVLQNTVALLEDLGHRVLAATSAREAIEAIERDKNIELVITDQLMPGMTGTQLIEHLRTAAANVSIILATGYGDLSPQAAAGVRRLSKPYTQQQLLAAIQQALPAT